MVKELVMLGYSFALNDPADTFGNANKWDLYLYDIQTYTRITFGSNTSLTECPVGSYIRGLSSGATGYTTDERDSNGTIQFLTDTSGVFQAGEQVVINGGSVTRTISTTRTYGVNDIKSVYQNVNGGSTETAAGSAGLSTAFAADTILNESIVPGFSSADIITIDATAGIATVTGRNLAGKIKGGDILSYNVAGNDHPNYLRVVGITTTGTSATVASTQSVDGVANGSLTSGNYTFKLASPSISGGDRAHLYAKLNSENISNVSFSGSNLVVDRQVSGKSTDNNGVVSIDRTDIGITSSFFEPYAFDRYAIFYSDGTAANLTADQVVVGGNSLDVTFSGLIPNQNNVFINASSKKNSITNKQKNYIRSEKKEISLTVSGVTTSVSGLTQNNNYGLRVEDHEISLNVPDVANVIAVYESLDNGSVILDKLTFAAGLNLNTSAILGEKLLVREVAQLHN